MQRFYLYLNMTKPRELLCLSFCQSDSQGKALSPAFLVSNIREMFPEMEIRQCGDMQEPMELLELPGISLDYFLRGLAGEAYQDNAVFQELYSWYLQSPEYRILVKNLQRHLFRTTVRQDRKNSGKDPLWRNFPVQCYPAGAFCGLCICTFSAVWPEGYRTCRV